MSLKLINIFLQLQTLVWKSLKSDGFPFWLKYRFCVQTYENAPLYFLFWRTFVILRFYQNTTYLPKFEGWIYIGWCTDYQNRKWNGVQTVWQIDEVAHIDLRDKILYIFITRIKQSSQTKTSSLHSSLFLDKATLMFCSG